MAEWFLHSALNLQVFGRLKRSTNLFFFTFFSAAKDTLLGKKCMEQETMDLRRAMYKSVGYKIDDNRRRLNTGGVTNFCIDWCNGYEVDNCQIVHPECGTASAAGPQVVAYIGDDSQCEDEILKIDQALDLVADAMEADCQELVSTRSFKCIISK